VNSGQGIATTVKALAVTAYIGEVFTATATLTAPLGDSFIPVPGKAVEFSFFDGLSTHTLLGYSNTVGVATATFTAPAQDGAYQYRAVFMGDLAYAASNDAAPVDDRRHPDTLAAADVAVNMSQDFAVQAVLSDARTAALLDGRPVVFEFFNGTTIISSATVTDAFGVAVATFTAPNMLGSYFYTARLTGDPLYADIVSTGTVLVVSQGEETFLVLDDVLAGTDEIFTATATFTCKGRPVSDRIITFSFDGVTRVATTTAYGIAVTTFTAPSSTGTFTFSASFAGDTAYKGVGCTAALTVIERESLEDPNPVEISCSSTTREITLRWPEVRKKLFLIKGYQIERTTDLRKNWEKVAFIYSTSSVLSYTCPEFHASVMYFRIRVATWDRQESKGVVVLEVPEAADSAAPDLENTNHIYLSDDRVALVSIPLKLMADIYSGGTASTAPLRVIVQQETDDRFLMTYQIRVKDENDRQIDDFTFKGNRHGIKVELSYEGLARRSPSLAQAASQQAAMYWFNEVEWIKLGGINDILSKTCSVYTQKLGRFSLGIAPVSESFAVTKVAPRIFTPEESSTVINRVHFYYENPSNAEVTIRIFDVSGALVRRALDREGDNIMYWDGRDKDGTVVKGGIYIYQIEAGNKIITGTVVVAK
jgi:hypothetical protein